MLQDTVLSYFRFHCRLLKYRDGQKFVNINIKATLNTAPFLKNYSICYSLYKLIILLLEDMHLIIRGAWYREEASKIRRVQKSLLVVMRRVEEYGVFLVQWIYGWDAVPFPTSYPWYRPLCSPSFPQNCSFFPSQSMTYSPLNRTVL